MTDKTDPSPTAEEALAAAYKMVSDNEAAKKAAADADIQKRAEALEPLKHLTDAEGFGLLLNGLRTIQPDFAGDVQIGPHVTGIIVCMSNLQAALS